MHPSIIVLNYFWRFNRSEEESAEIIGSLGRLTIGITTYFPEFGGLNIETCSTDLDRVDGCSSEILTATITKAPNAYFVDPLLAATSLVDAIKDDLTRLNSPYILPVPELT